MDPDQITVEPGSSSLLALIGERLTALGLRCCAGCNVWKPVERFPGATDVAGSPVLRARACHACGATS